MLWLMIVASIGIWSSLCGIIELVDMIRNYRQENLDKLKWVTNDYSEKAVHMLVQENLLMSFVDIVHSKYIILLIWLGVEAFAITKLFVS